MPNQDMLIIINTVELFEATKEAIKKYGEDLRTSDVLQNKFIIAWSSMEKREDMDNDQEREAEDLQRLLQFVSPNKQIPLM